MARTRGTQIPQETRRTLDRIKRNVIKDETVNLAAMKAAEARQYALEVTAKYERLRAKMRATMFAWGALGICALAYGAGTIIGIIIGD